MTIRTKFPMDRARNMFCVVAAVMVAWSVLEVIHLSPHGKSLEHLHAICHACEKAVQILVTVSIAIVVFPAKRLSFCGILVWSGLGLVLLGRVFVNAAICDFASSFGVILVAVSHLFLLKREIVKGMRFQSGISKGSDPSNESKTKSDQASQ
jgi:hypothetical protein